MGGWLDLGCHAALALMSLAVAACASAQGAAAPGRLVAEVRADAAGQWQHRDPSALVIAADEVTWGDGSLGCPQPGQAATQALVPGWRLVLRDGPRTLSYHADRHGRWVRCPPERAQAPLPGAATR